jgi:DNA mismatch repair ATPase MutL
LDELGGTSLGFRGEALSSLVDVAAAVEVTTRVEGESMAVKMEIGRDGVGGR